LGLRHHWDLSIKKNEKKNPCEISGTEKENFIDDIEISRAVPEKGQ
jgi:hypothetical protein